MGYSIRLESRRSADTKLLLCTTGVLVRVFMGGGGGEGGRIGRRGAGLLLGGILPASRAAVQPATSNKQAFPSAICSPSPPPAVAPPGGRPAPGPRHPSPPAAPLHPLQLRRLVDDPLLAGTSHVVVDEVCTELRSEVM